MKNKVSILIIITIIATAIAIINTNLRPYDVTIKKINGDTKNTSIPLIQPSNFDVGNEEYKIDGKIKYYPFSQHIVNITPDDCINYMIINHTLIDIQDTIQGENCNPTKGFDVDLKRYMKPGINTFQIGLEDYGGWLGLSMKSSYYDPIYKLFLSLLIIEVTSLIYIQCRTTLKLDKILTFLLIAGLLLRLCYLGYTTYTERTYDVATSLTGHLSYIKFLGDNLRLPNPDNTWEYHQAPLYYIVSAIIYKAGEYIHVFYPSLLQITSLLYNLIFLVYGIFILKLLLKSKQLLVAAIALFIFWPSNIIHSIRIGNDQLYYMFSTISIYYFLRWYQENKKKLLYLAILFTSMTIITKLTGIIIVILLVSLYIHKIISHKINLRKYKRETTCLILAILISLSFSLFRNLQTEIHDKHFNLINGSSGYTMTSDLAVGNGLKNYLEFDLKNYMDNGFTSSWDDHYGRQYFLNYLFKTMLFGEFSFQPSIEETIAKIMGLYLLEMIIFLTFGLFSIIKHLDSQKKIIIAWSILSVASLISYRHTYHFSSNGDYRFILPTLIPFVYLVVSGIDFFAKKKLYLIEKLGYLIIYLYIPLNIVFFTIPIFLK